MSLQTCSDTSEAVVLEGSLGLYLKPVSKIKINVQMPKLKNVGQSISTWNVMEKLKTTIRPDQFIVLKSLKIASNVIKFEGELETKSSCERALARLRASGSLKLSGFSEKLQIRAAHAPCSGPTRHEWEAFYRDAKGVNEMKPGERPDTIYLQDIPVRWFASSSKPSQPSEKIVRKAFSSYGRIRRMEIPSNETNIDQSTFGKTSSLHNDLLFDTYIQYEEYVEFSIAMDSLRGKKLLYKDTDGKVYSADIKVDFDKTNYLSDRCINERAAESKKVNIASSAESAKLSYNKDSKHLNSSHTSKLLDSSSSQDESKEGIIQFERKLPKSEAKCLLKELFSRVEKSEKLHALTSTSSQPFQCSEKRKKDDKECELKVKKEKLSSEKSIILELEKKEKLIEKEKLSSEKSIVLELEKKKKEKLIEKERLLKEKLLRNMRLRELQKIAESREKLRKKLAGSKSLKSVLAVKKKS